MEEASSVPILGAVGEQIKRIKPLSLLPLVALIFYDVSGGPFGTEDAVSSGGPMLALLAFLILPFVWSVPEALVTAELATTFPENSGYVAWVTAAFGPFWGFQEGFWSWVSGVTDNSLYPVMFMSYLEAIIPALADGWQRRLLLFGVSITLSYVNYRGLTIVGRVAVGMTFFIVLPFVVLVGMSVPQIEPSNWKQMDWNAVKWGPFLNVMFWNLNYWDSVSTLAGEVPRPHKTFPRALAGAVVLVVLTYLLPLMAGLGVDADPDQWQLGFYASLAEKIGGRWLGWWIVAAAAVSQIGQFEAEMSSDSFQLQGMAERGFLPACLARRSKHDTPTLGIILSSLGVCTLVTFNFLQIVELLNIVYCLAELLEFVAFIYLRIKSPHLHRWIEPYVVYHNGTRAATHVVPIRPYKVPLPTWGCALMLLPASCLLCTLLVMPVLRLDWQVMGWTLGTVVVGGAMYPLLQTARERGWCEFVGVSPHDFKASLFEGLPIAATPSLSNLHLLHDSQPQSEDES